jgi:putative FmdB family regulatory protein
MVTYSYICNACGNEFDVERSIGDTAPATCPQCGANNTERVYSLSGHVWPGKAVKGT